jgi:hypothetical protein
VAKSAHKLARASQRECNGEAQHVPTSMHHGMRTYGNDLPNGPQCT